MKRIILFQIIFFFVASNAQQFPGNLILIPDIPEFITLKCDFHMHTVFSDGNVWPTIRIEEAWQEGLDAIAISDHIEYQPHRDDVSQNLNRSYELAKQVADKAGILLIKALEITRQMPPGHLNALFINEGDSLKKADYVDVLEEAREQGAFVFWNHPGWTAQAPDGIKWYDEHTRLLEKGLFHGIEVVNSNEFYPEALEWCIKKNLTIIGNSDMHETLGLFLIQNRISHRPITLVFAKERSLAGIKEALFNHRTAVWYDNKVIGSNLYLEPLFRNSLSQKVIFRNEKIQLIKFTNHSDIEISIKIKGNDRTYILPPRTNIIIQLLPDIKNFEVNVTNFIIGKNMHLTSLLSVQ